MRLLSFITVVVVFFSALPLANGKGLTPTKEKEITLYGFLTKEEGKAIVVSGRHKYVVPWAEFVAMNKFGSDSKKRQAKYKLLTKNMVIQRLPASEYVK